MHTNHGAFGAAVALDGGEPLPLDALSAPVVVARGFADVFAVDPGSGARRHVLRLLVGATAFPVAATPGLALTAVFGLDAALRPLGEGDDVVALRDAWIVALAGAAFGPGEGWPEALPAGEIAPGVALAGGTAVRWIVVTQGRLEALGLALQPGDAPFPLAAGLRLVAAEAARIGIAEAPDSGLEHFHRVALLALAQALRADEVCAAARLQARAQVDRDAMAHAMDHLAATIAKRNPAPAYAAVRTPVVGAFALVAEALGVSLPGEPLPSVAHTIPALARFAGLCARPVILRGRWRRGDYGPLIGRWSESGAEVALLPSRPARYVAVDPQSGAHHPVNAAVVARLSPSATMLYAPLPASVRGLWGLATHAFEGAARADLLRLAAAGIAGGVLATAFPVAAGLIFRNAIPDADRAAVVALVGGLVAAALGAAAFNLVRSLALLRIETRLEARLQPALMQRLLSLHPRFFRDRSAGDLYNRLQALPLARRLLAGAVLDFTLSLALTLPSLLVIAFHGGSLAALALALVGFGGVVEAAGVLGEWRPRREAARLAGRESGLLVQMLQGIGKLRVSAGEPRLFAVWAGLFGARRRALARGRLWGNARAAFMSAYPTLALAEIFLAAFNRLSANAGLTLGGFVAVNAAFAQMMSALAATSAAFESLLTTAPSLERLAPILAAEPETVGLKSDPGPLSGEIEFNHVSFRYAPDGPDVIDDLTLKIRPGEFVALVGASGSGKSTLLRLLLGFEKPTAGDIIYQNRPIDSLDLTALRRRIGVVLQNGRTLSGNIFENMTNGAPYSLDDAWRAAEMAGLAEDIRALPMGMHTQLTEGSPALSGGQAQRLMIARALIGRPDVLMFDEATSALDNMSQAVVTAALERLGVTRLVIAHRLSTVERADRIVVIDNGRIVEQGRFSALMAENGALAALARRQQI